MTQASDSVRWFKEKSSAFTGELLYNEPLAKHSFYKIGGPSSIFAVPKGKEDLKVIADGIAETQLPYFVLGKGTNLLIADQGFEGIVIDVTRMNSRIESIDDSVLSIGASMPLFILLQKAGREGWAGFELLTGIPGTVGGAVFMNAGTHLGWSSKLLVGVEIFSLEEGKWIQFSESDLKYSYRKNHFLPKDALIWSAKWKYEKTSPGKVAALIKETLDRRKKTQPIELPSCGSVFKNPEPGGKHAWQVIDEIGLRGKSVGGAVFSEKHCNFIVNQGGAKASDVKALIDLAKSRAKKIGVEIHEEVRYLGFL